MLCLDKVDITNSIEQAHAEALESVRGMDDLFLKYDIIDYVEDYYAREFVNALLPKLTDEEWPSGFNDWTIEELAIEFNKYDFNVKVEEYGQTKVLNVRCSGVVICLEDDEDGKIMVYGSDEYVIGNWDHAIVDLFKIIRAETVASKIYDRTKDFIKEQNLLKIRNQVLTTTAIGIIHSNLGDVDHSINNVTVKDKLFECDIETDWGRLNIASTLEDLPEQIATILQEKEIIDQMFVTFDKIEGIEE